MQISSIKKNPFNVISRIINYFKIKKFLRKEKIDNFLILETYEKIFKYLTSRNKQIKKINSILTIHNIFDYFEVEKLLMERYNLKKVKNYQKKFLEKFNKYVVLNENIKNKLEKDYNIKSEVLPFKTTNKNDIKKRELFLNNLNNKQITFIIPGNVESKRKNYFSIIDSFSKYNNKNYKLIFLGRVIENKIIDYAKKKEINLEYFNEYLPESKFNEYILNSHFLIGFISNDLPYGILKASGVEFDGPTMGVPVIVNNKNVTNNNGLFIYSEDLDNTLLNIFNDINNNSYYTKYGKIAFEKMKNNTSDKYVDTMKRLLEAE
jgi:hypothetical protein